MNTRERPTPLESELVLATLHADLDVQAQRLCELSDWLPARALLRQIDTVRGELDRLQAAWETRLVVAIVGPSGAGKSTLLNALAGRAISPTGLRRPTTREVIVYARATSDADPLIDAAGADHVEVVTDREAEGLEHLILVDTPDTNTIPENQALLERLLPQADVILALFAAENPKLQDNIAYLQPYVERLPAEAVVPVINRVDRVPRDQLVNEIVPDFRHMLAEAWGAHDQPILLISARRVAPGGTFPPDEQPLHDLNQFPDLQALLFERLNQRGTVVDRRLAQAEHLNAMIETATCQAVQRRADAQRQAQAAMDALREQLRERLGALLLQRTEAMGRFDLHADLYGLMAPRWWGPVGWLVTLWSLMLRLGSYIKGLGRRRSPVAALFANGEENKAALPVADLDLWLQPLESLYAEAWPPLADALVAAGFDPAVRQADKWRAGARESVEDVLAQSAGVYEEHIQRLASRLSAWPLQILWNLPTLGLIGWVGIQTVLRFFDGRYLPADYFRHAGITLLIVWALSFVLLQIIVAGAVGRSLQRRVARRLAERVPSPATRDLARQLEALQTLAAECQQ